MKVVVGCDVIRCELSAKGKFNILRQVDFSC